MVEEEGIVSVVVYRVPVELNDPENDFKGKVKTVVGLVKEEGEYLLIDSDFNTFRLHKSLVLMQKTRKSGNDNHGRRY